MAATGLPGRRRNGHAAFTSAAIYAAIYIDGIAGICRLAGDCPPAQAQTPYGREKCVLRRLNWSKPSVSHLRSCGGIFDWDRSLERLEELNQLAEDPDLWQDQERAQKVMRDRTSSKSR